MSVKVRFAPSPTGFVHIGSLRTALYNYLYAKQTGGKFLLRIEDTDQTRFVDGAIESLLKSLRWANIEVDEGVALDENENMIQKGENGPYIQSERLDIYKKYIEYLLEKGYAYYCFCSKDRLDRLRKEQMENGLDPMYDGHCKSLTKEEIEQKIKNGEEYVIRLNVPKGQDITFKDVVRGVVTINSDTVDDQVLIKSDGFPTYHFAVVVDDHFMEITHVIRGEEWLPSTPKHILLYDMFGWEKPEFVHLPNILNQDRKKLSKRQGDVGVQDFYNKGYLPEGLVNYISLLGWSPETDQEIFSIKELEEQFSLKRVSSSGGVFDVEKLNWVNSQHIKDYDSDKLVNIAAPFIIKDGVLKEKEIDKKWLVTAMDILKDRIEYLSQFPELIKPFLSDDMEIEDDALEFMKSDHIKNLHDILVREISARGDMNAQIADEIFSVIKKEGIKGKNLFMGVRVLTTGNCHGPDMPKTMELLGKERLLKRLENAKKYI